MLDIYKRRMAAAGAGLEALGLDSLIVSEPAALFYLTGEIIHPGERLTVLVFRQKEPPFWLRNRLFPLKEGMGLSMEEADGGRPADISFEDGEEGLALLSPFLPKGTTGIDKTWPSHFLLSLMALRPDLSFKNGSPLVDGLRAVKDE